MRNPDMPQPLRLRLHDIVIPVNITIPEPYLEPVRGKVIGSGHDGEDLFYVVEFRTGNARLFRHNLELVYPYLTAGDRVTIVPDPPKQVESLLRLSTTKEMATEIGIVRRVGLGWGCRDEDAAIPENWDPTKTMGTHWYYDVEWPSGHRDHFLHTGDLARVEEG